MNKIFFAILIKFPWIEVLLRFIYWRLSICYKLTNYILKSVTGEDKNKHISVKLNINDFKNHLKSNDVFPGDTLILHSSFDNLLSFNLKPDLFLDEVIDYLGPTGTLIIPCIPYLKNQPGLFHRFDINNYVHTPVYNVQKTRPWTGILGLCLMRRQGALRSISPLNTMVVYGRHATDLISDLVISGGALPCDSNSVLSRSLDFNSKILFLGVDEIDSMTMIHVAEDTLGDLWPVKNWYWTRPFNIVNSSSNQIISLKERRPIWSIFFPKMRFKNDLISNDILKVSYFNDLKCSFCDSNLLIAYLKSRNNKGYPYLVPFWLKY
mgnify:CR=1 FL=1